MSPSVKSIGLSLVTGLAALLGFGAPAAGQPLFGTAESLEWMAADSDLIVRGPIVDLIERADEAGGGWMTATVRVAETLKGKHRPDVTFLLRTNSDDEVLDRWQERGQEVLVFLVEGQKLTASSPEYARHQFATRNGLREGAIVELSPEAGPQVFTLDLRALTRPEEILRATKAAIDQSDEAGPPRSHLVRMPEPAVRATPWGKYLRTGGGVRLEVPIDLRLERQARAWVRSPDKALRQEGAQALHSFRSAANEAILRGLLDDPGTWMSSVTRGIAWSGRSGCSLSARRPIQS